MRNEKGQFVKGFHSTPNTEFKKGIRASPDTEFKKGLVPWSKKNKGKYKFQYKNPELHSQRLREKRLGFKYTKESRMKMSISHLGYKMSAETKEKIRLAFTGSRNHQWRGGVRPIRLSIRNCAKYVQWRSDIFKRDNFTCVLCEAKCKKGRAVYLEADHYPKSFSQIVEEHQIKNLEQALSCQELWDVNNGRTLCHNCHRGTLIGKPRLWNKKL